MKIETKYDIGKEVWLMNNNQVYQGVIANIRVSVCNEVNTTYTVRVKNMSGSWTIDRNEGKLFESKEELLKSL